jgi:very-short-patch-repair endonuclease
VVYRRTHENIIIICPKHGEFEQQPANHLRGEGCTKCKYEIVSKKLSSCREEFIAKAKEIHDNKYDYSKVNYINNRHKVCIICPKHGEFWQTPNKHLLGQKCSICANEEQSILKRKSKEEFIRDACKVHGSKYNYTNVEYINARTKVNIICPIHGKFAQTPTMHLRGKGCPICNESKLENELSNFLNNNGINFKQLYHIEWLGSQHLDFYLPQYNIGIECQGGQHFKSVEWFGGNDGFMKTKERDERKRKLCEEHGIKLLYYSNLGTKYPYEVFEDKEKLLEEIKKYGNS